MSSATDDAVFHGGPRLKAIDGEAESQIGPLEEPLNAARAVLRIEFTHSGLPKLHFWQGEFYRWNGAAYRPLAVIDVEARIYAVLERHSQKPNRRRVRDVLHAMQAVSLIGQHIEPPIWIDEPLRDMRNAIVCNNGVLDLGSMELMPLSPALFCLAALPVDYDANAAPPFEWLKFLSSLWSTDDESIATLQEILGCLLTARTEFQKIFLIVGPRRSGKGTILRIMATLLGVSNVAAPTLSSLATDFGLQSLIGKLAAFIGDARLGGRTDQTVITERLLSLSGEDHVNVSRKFLPDYTARLPVRFVLSTNELPRLMDSSGALASRFVVLLLTQSFYGREDLDLERRLCTELPAILNWCIDGRARLLERGRFVQPVSAAGAIEQLEDLGSPIGAFLREACTVEQGQSIPVEDLYEVWRAWCEKQGRDRPGSRQAFGRDLRAACPGLRITQPRLGEERIRAYEGIGLARTGTHANALQSVHARVAHNGNERVPSRAKCVHCDDEGCQWCQS